MIPGKGGNIRACIHVVSIRRLRKCGFVFPCVGSVLSFPATPLPPPLCRYSFSSLTTPTSTFHLCTSRLIGFRDAPGNRLTTICRGGNHPLLCKHIVLELGAFGKRLGERTVFPSYRPRFPVLHCSITRIKLRRCR